MKIMQEADKRRETPAAAAPPEAKISMGRGISIVWLIPVIAALIGGWLAYKTFSERGPLVTIAFKTAGGVDAGKTKVKYKDVVIGEVVDVDLSEGLKEALVSARLVKEAAPYLTTGTRFWVERPRITLQGITGLGTLMAGVHIAIDPSEEGDASYVFRGLDQPPIVTRGARGKPFLLHAERLESLSVGSPVTRRQIQVGQVVGYELDPNGRGVAIHIFVDAPHDGLVRRSSRFWVSSGLELRLTADGLDLNTDSVASLVVGAIAFDTPDSLEPAESALENTRFELFASRDAVVNREFVEKEHCVLYFQGSVRGLSVDAPVEFRGIRIGRVTDVKLQLNADSLAFAIPVMVEIEPGRIEMVNGHPAGGKDGESVIRPLVDKGLRGQLKTGSLLTGQLYVDLDFHAPPGAVEIVRQGDFWVLPTVPGPMEALATRLRDFLSQVETWPLEQLGEDVGASLHSLRRLMESGDMDKSLAHLERTLASLERAADRLNRQVVPEAGEVIQKAGDLVARNAPLYTDLKQLIQELSAAARAVRATADYLGRHPESLIRGK